MKKEKLEKIFSYLIEYLFYSGLAILLFIAIVYVILELKTNPSLIWEKKILSIPKFLLFISWGLAALLYTVGKAIFSPGKPGFFLQKDEEEKEESKNESNN